jgi:sigma-E factor negative regulatory protein RseB
MRRDDVSARRMTMLDTGAASDIPQPRAVSRGAAPGRRAAIALAALVFAADVCAQDAATVLSRAATAARTQNYTGTILYQHGSRSQTSRLAHLNDALGEQSKLANLEGPPREVIRTTSEVRCYYSDAKVVRVEAPEFRNAFPTLSPQQQKTLLDFYDMAKGEANRIAGRDAQAWVFTPKDGNRFPHKLWTDVATGILLKAALVNERNEMVEQFAFLDISLGARLTRDQVAPTAGAAPADWQVQDANGSDADSRNTGWVATRLPAGFARIAEGYRPLHGKRQPVAHIVYSDGLVAISVFVEPLNAPPRNAGAVPGPVNAYTRQVDEYLVTVLGEAPGATLKDIAFSVARR